MTAFGQVGVVGAGLMGGGIAQVSAVAGYATIVRDVNDDLLARARRTIEQSLTKFVEKQKLTAEVAAAARGRLSFTTDLLAFRSTDLVIEAVTEDLEIKNRLWAELDQICPLAAVFASNTSSLPIGAQAAATTRPDRFVGLHFFSPVPLMPLVEVIRAAGTSDETFDRATTWVRSLGKEAIAAKDTPGFIVNRLLIPYLMDAIRALEHGVGRVTDLDLGMKLGAGHPMGPLTLADMVGLDVCLRVADIMFAEFREPQYAPPRLLRQLVGDGLLGRKTGRGFYDYSVNPPTPMDLA